jgi:D-arabinose 1-dehydrogenase-like Zn-dependent alcohol dehydrogenase
MKAAVFHEPHRPLVLEEVCRPRPGDGEVLVRVVASGVCQSDLHHIDRGIPTYLPPPLVLGHGAAGVVEQLGPDTRGRTVGERVLLPALLPCGECQSCRQGSENLCDQPEMYGNSIAGTYAEFVVAPARYCIPLPEGISLEEGALLSHAVATPFHATKNSARVGPGETVVVFGCGGYGTSVVQCAVALGAGLVIAVDRSESRLEVARRLGAGETLNPDRVTQVDKEIRKLTPAGVDVAFETLGNRDALRTAFDSVRRGGRLCMVGYSRHDLPLPLRKIVRLKIEVTGCQGCAVTEYPRLFDLVGRGMIQVSPIMTGKVPLEKINDAFELLRRGEGLRTLVLPGGHEGSV